MTNAVTSGTILFLGLLVLGCGNASKAGHGQPAGADPCGEREKDRVAGPATCSVQAGANWHFRFSYPAAAGRIPRLKAHFDLERRKKEEAFQPLIAYAAEHPETADFFEEADYLLDANRPELIALSFRVSEYSGGAHGLSGGGTLLWDKAADREIENSNLFTDSSAAMRELARVHCPMLARARAAEAEASGGFNRSPCPKPPYEAALLATPDGRINTLKITYHELDGYAGGEYAAFIPVSPQLLGMIQQRYKGAFALSSEPSRVCNANLPQQCVTAANAGQAVVRKPQPQ